MMWNVLGSEVLLLLSVISPNNDLVWYVMGCIALEYLGIALVLALLNTLEWMMVMDCIWS